MSGQKPTVGRQVHYVSYGTPGGEYPCTCRTATITEVGGWQTILIDAVEGNTAGMHTRTLTQVYDPATVGVEVVNPSGLFFRSTDSLNGGVAYDPGSEYNGNHPATGAVCATGSRTYPGGTWHWPERA